MLVKNKVVGRLFRNKKIPEFDFYVTSIRKNSVIGFWIKRGTMTMINTQPDVLPLDRINFEDWKEVLFS